MHNRAGANLITEAWVRRTGGALDPAERRRIWVDAGRRLVGQVLGTLLDPLRLRAQSFEFPAAPDSALSRAAEEAAREQPDALIGHGYRTWLFGSALAYRSRIALDRELFYVASLLHDTGLTSAVAGRDFTIRSAELVHRTCAQADVTDPAIATRIADAVVAHATWGISPEVDPIAHFVQAGAVLDLTGLQLWRLPSKDVRRVYRDYPAKGTHEVVAELIAREARAVPNGRFGMLTQTGLHKLVKFSPTRQAPPRTAGERS